MQKRPLQIDSVLEAAQTAGRRVFSAEFFPPKTPEAESTLWSTISSLQPFNLDFVSVTYGAGGSTQETSLRVTERIVRDTGWPTLAHLTCVGATAAQLDSIVDQFVAAGVSNILALRGDPTAGAGTPWVTTPGGYTYAVELVQALAARDELCIAVSAFPEGHPESSDRNADASVLAMKQAAGAKFAITNLFFDANFYFEMLTEAKAAGCTMPVLPGLMPVTSYSQIARFSTLSGAHFPEELAARFAAVSEDADAVRELGIESATAMALQLLEGGAPGIHLYTLNRSTSTARILENLAAAGWR